MRSGESNTLQDGNSATSQRPRILVVDDHRDTVESMILMLSLWGYAVQGAGDGLAALECARLVQLDVALIDIALPGMDGWELARRLRAIPGGAGLLLLAVTGYSSAEARDTSRRAGFDDHLIKPVCPQYLQRLLARRAAEIAPT